MIKHFNFIYLNSYKKINKFIASLIKNNMGNKHSKKEKCNKTEFILTETYRNTDVEFSPNEVTNIKLRIRDAENYFRTKFEIFFNFNNMIFRERLCYFYENFNRKIEWFSKNKNLNQLFNVLIDFDDELIDQSWGLKIDFESLFVIIFEKLEINIILFFYMTKVNSHYVSNFLSQLIENAELYKYNRKFDCLYFLFANTDYFIKNDAAILYASNKSHSDKNIFSNFEVCEINNEYMKAAFQFKEKLIIPKYSKIEANNFLENLLEEIKPNYIKLFTYINFSLPIENFISENEDALKLIEFVCDICPINNLEIQLSTWMDIKVLEIFIKKIIYFVHISTCEQNLFCLKIMLKNSNSNNSARMSQSNRRNFKLKTIGNYVNKILNGLNTHNQMHNKRKIVIELFEVFDESNDFKSNNKLMFGNYSDRRVTSFSYSNFHQYLFFYEKLIFHWFVKKDNSEIKKILSVLLNVKKYKKLNEIKIIENLCGFIDVCYRTNYSQKMKNISKLEMQEIFK